MPNFRGTFITEGQAIVRVKAEDIIQWTYYEDPTHPLGNGKVGEAVKVRAEGHIALNKELFPISLHITAPAGCGLIPVLGDHLFLTVERYDKPVE